MYWFYFVLLLHGSNSLHHIEQKKVQPVKSRKNKMEQSKNFMADFKSNPKQFIAQVINLDPEGLRSVIALLESLRASSEATRQGLIDKLDRKTNEVNEARKKLTSAENDVIYAQAQLAGAEQALTKANASLVEKENDRAYAEHIHTAKVREKKYCARRT